MSFFSKPSVRVVSLALLLLSLASCQPPLEDSSQASLLQTPTLNLLVSPAQIPVETPLRMRLETRDELVKVTGELRGISMYMGRIPLQWRQAELTTASEMSVWTSEFFLGACSDPNMQWQLELWLEYADGSTVLKSVQFTSSWR